VKTQWLPAVLRAAIEEHASLEVVSEHELNLATASGAEPATIIFNGVGKTSSELERAFDMGVRVHLDSDAEAQEVIRLAIRRPSLCFRIGLRANIDIGVKRGRFGIDAEDGQLQAAWRKLRHVKNIMIEGLHVHISGARLATQFGARMERLISLTDELWGTTGAPDYLDIGGGFCGTMPEELAVQMPYAAPTFDDYAAAIAAPYLRRWPKVGPRLVLEPGVSVAADVGWLAARVLAVKHIAGQRHAITSASVYTVKPMQHKMNMPFIHIPAHPRQSPGAEHTVISGYTCMESDVIHANAAAPVEPGDWLLFANCGAYTNVLTPRFIRGVPPVFVESSGALCLAMRGEVAEDWLAYEVLPPQ
jgi:diaminopimelate decarboxylase